jgi:hemerythrin superfamily protein
VTQTIHSADDVVTFLKGQHQQIKSLFAQVKQSTGTEKEEAFTHLRRLLAVHETAEEEVVHPRARKALDHGESVIEARLEEENHGKEALSELEKLDVDSAEFDRMFAQFEQDIIAHAEAEEREEFNGLRAALEDDQLERMRKAVELAEKTAPTHPHAGVESASQNMLAGPFASMMDRAKDAITGKH